MSASTTDNAIPGGLKAPEGDKGSDRSESPDRPKLERRTGRFQLDTMDVNAMAVDRLDMNVRIRLVPKSQWQKAFSRAVACQNNETSGNKPKRTTEAMSTDEEKQRFFTCTLTDEEIQASKRNKRDGKITDAYEDFLRLTEHRAERADMGAWYGLYTGDAAEQLLYYFAQGWSLQALAWIAKSKFESSRQLVSGHEQEMVKNFIWARTANPDDLFRGHFSKRIDISWRAKTQAEEDAYFIFNKINELKPRVGRRRAAMRANNTRRPKLPLPPGAMARPRIRPYKLCPETKPKR